MPQAKESVHERRREPRHPAAFAFWFSAEESRPPASAWMLNVSDSGAAFLTSAERAPQPGARIRCEEMFCRDRLVREEHLRLPALARVLRVDDERGITRRVAVRFEADVRVEDSRPSRGVVCRQAVRPSHAPIPPPLPEEGLRRQPSRVGSLSRQY